MQVRVYGLIGLVTVKGVNYKDHTVGKGVYLNQEIWYLGPFFNVLLKCGIAVRELSYMLIVSIHMGNRYQFM